MEKFLYIVKPRIPIRNLVKGKLIFKETTLMLDLDEVKMCLKHGPVYRKFANDSKTAIQVTLNNCERLHQRDYVTELNVASTFIPKEEPSKPVEPVKEEVVESIEDTATVDGIKEVETTKEVVESSAEASDDIVESVDEDTVETTEEVVEATDEVVVEDKVETQKQNNNHNNTKNKKRK